MELEPVIRQAHEAFRNDDAGAIRQILENCPELRARINEPIGGFDSPAIINVRSAAMLDVLLEAGADIDARSRWWAGGFGLLDSAPPDVARHALTRGATLTAHAAARLGMIDELRDLVEADPSLVHARGGDGQSPLHFAASIEIADYLLSRGADPDMRDIDHESTPAQWMVRSRQPVARHLVARGAKADILMAAAFGDEALVRKQLADDPESLHLRVSNEWFPMIGYGGKTGGTIYQWELGWYVSAVQVARDFGHTALFDLLMERMPDEEKLVNYCWLHEEAAVRKLLASDSDLASRLTQAGKRQLAHAARNNDTAAARLMIEAGLPTDATSQHNATPLHWAAWHGNAEIVRLLLSRGADIRNNSNEFSGTPLNWAEHGKDNGWHKETGDYPATVAMLRGAGAAGQA